MASELAYILTFVYKFCCVWVFTHQVTAIDTASSKIVFKETITYAGGDKDDTIVLLSHSKS